MITHLAKHDLNCTCSFDFFYPTRGPKFTISEQGYRFCHFCCQQTLLKFFSENLSRGSVDAIFNEKIVNFKNEETVAGKKLNIVLFYFQFYQN